MEKRYLVAVSCGEQTSATSSARLHGIMRGVTLTEQPDGTAPDGSGAPASVDAPATADRAGRRRLDRGLLIASLVIAAGAVLIVWGMFDALTGDDGVDRPDAIESLTPVENAVQVLQQEGIIVDFEYGYEARLFIDGVELPVTRLGEIEVEPGQQIDLPPTAVFEPGNAVLSFQPAEGAPIESFDEGPHEAKVIFWRTDEGTDSALSYRWTFNVV